MKGTLDFIVVGAQKAGTTALFEYLRRHPELYLPAHKEAAYFSHDAEIRQDWNEYLRDNFSSAGPDLKWGTVSPSYMVGGVYARSESERADSYDVQTVPRRIYERSPDVKLMAILRDPVERARSHHKMMVMTGVERRSFDEAIDELLHRDTLRSCRAHPSEMTGYVTWGEYGRILTGYYDVFPREQILVAYSDELEAAPERLLFRIHGLLGVAQDFVPDNLGKRYREGGTARRVSRLKPDTIVEGIARNSVSRSLWHSVPRGGKDRLNRAFASAAYRIDLWNRRSQDEVDQPSCMTLARLREHFASDNEQLTTLLGEMPPWSTGASAEDA